MNSVILQGYRAPIGAWLHLDMHKVILMAAVDLSQLQKKTFVPFYLAISYLSAKYFIGWQTIPGRMLNNSLLVHVMKHKVFKKPEDLCRWLKAFHTKKSEHWIRMGCSL